MKRIGLLTALVVALTPALASAYTTTLLNPHGTPVSGQWQKWLDQSHMPTYAGSMVLDTNLRGAECDAPGSAIDGCTSSVPFAPVAASEIAMPETAVNHMDLLRQPQDYQRWTLLYEQGHVIDFEYLTDADRAAFLELWNQPQPPAGVAMSDYWWSGEDSFTQTSGTVYGEWFSAAYASCAMYRNWSPWRLPENAVNGTPDYPGFSPVFEFRSARERREIRLQDQACGMIRDWITQGHKSAS